MGTFVIWTVELLPKRCGSHGAHCKIVSGDWMQTALPSLTVVLTRKKGAGLVLAMEPFIPNSDTSGWFSYGRKNTGSSNTLLQSNAQPNLNPKTPISAS